MEFNISLETDLMADKRSHVVHSLSDYLGECFKSECFGGSVAVINIKLIAIRPVEGFEKFIKAADPKYFREQKVRTLDGSSVSIKNLFTFDIGLNSDEYCEFIVSDELALKVLISSLRESVDKFSFLPKSIKDFDLSRFELCLNKYLDDSIGKLH